MENLREQISSLRAVKRSRGEAEKVLRFFMRLEKNMSTRILRELKRRRNELEKKLILYVKLEEKFSIGMKQIREELAAGTASDERRKSRQRIYGQLDRYLPYVRDVKMELENCCILISNAENHLAADQSSLDEATMLADEDYE